MIKKYINKYIFMPILALILVIYIILVDFIVAFSSTVNLYFFTGAILLLTEYYVLSNPINYKERGPSKRYILINVVFVFFYVITVFLILFNLTYLKDRLPNNSKYDYIIVFGAGISKDYNTIMNSRIDNAVLYANKYEKCKFVLTGAKGNDEPIAEAYYMKEYMVNRGVDADRIIAEPFSVNTNQNVSNSLEMILNDVIKRNRREYLIDRPIQRSKEKFDVDFLNIGFMSNNFHLTRISLIAEKKGVSRPYLISCDTDLFLLPYMYVRENLSMYKAFVLGELF